MLVPPFTNLQQALGLSRGPASRVTTALAPGGPNVALAAGGLWMSLLRQQLSFFSAIATAERRKALIFVAGPGVNTDGEDVVTSAAVTQQEQQQLEARLLWLEMLLQGVATAVTLKGALAHLIDEDLVGLIVAFLRATTVGGAKTAAFVGSGTGQDAGKAALLARRSRSYTWLCAESYVAQVRQQ